VRLEHESAATAHAITFARVFDAVRAAAVGAPPAVPLALSFHDVYLLTRTPPRRRRWWWERWRWWWGFEDALHIGRAIAEVSVA
jgi:hypothetical protein